MTKDEIRKKIYELDTEDKIKEFVKERINELENASLESTVGQGYTDTFKEYISRKTHYKPADKLGDTECPDLVYDDIEPYVKLIEEIRKSSLYNEPIVFNIISFIINDYLQSGVIFERIDVYFGRGTKAVSIKTIKDEKCAYCSEKAGMAHNMLKFLGIDSKLACGYRNDEAHAYIVIYPNGYDFEPAVIYDPSFWTNFVNGNKEKFFAYYSVLDEENHQKLMSGSPIKVDLIKTERYYRRLYGQNGSLDDFVFKVDESVYSVGLGITPEMSCVSKTIK